MKFNFLRIYAVLLLLLFIFTAPSYATTGNYLNINETWNGESVVNFSVDTNYSDIIGFAVGTNFSFNFGANVDLAASDPAPDDWVGTAAVKKGGTDWQEVIYDPTFKNPPSYQDLPSFIDLNISAFEDYTSAFLFYSSGTTATSLNPLFTNGFSGYAFNNDSVFAAFRAEGTTITGDTSVVPIPGAAILLFSGLISLVCIRRKK